MKQILNDHRWVQALLLVLLMAGSVWLFWRWLFNADVRFLPQHAPAAWVVYPSPPNVAAHPIATTGESLCTVFRRTFVVATPSPSATLSLATLETATVLLNDKPVVSLDWPRKDWKTPKRFDVGGAIQSGTNVISVMVTNRAGLPALWLCLTIGETDLVTDETWEASCVGATWQKAFPATRVRPIQKGHLIDGGENPSALLLARWKTHLGFLLFSFSTIWLTLRLRKSGDPAFAVYAVSGAVVLMVLCWSLLFWNNTATLPPISGFDANSHLEYIHYIQEQHKLPRAEEGWEMHQPPLYYLTMAVLFETLGLSVKTNADLLALQVFSLLIAIGQILLVAGCLCVLFPRRPYAVLAGTLLAACLPVHLYHAQFLTNETLFAFLMTASFFLTLLILRDDQHRWWLYGALGVFLGAALLTKVSAVVIIPVWMLVLARHLITVCPFQVRIWVRTFGLLLAICLLVCGWHYWRSWMNTGSIFNFHRNWDYGLAWWQEDGYRTADYFFRFGESLRAPFFSGFHSFADGIYSTLWGDGLGGGVNSIDGRPPWNYGLQAAGYLIALVPTAILLLGFLLFCKDAVIKRCHQSWLLVGVSICMGLALVYFSLIAPGISQTRSSFVLMLIVPMSAFTARALDLSGPLSRWFTVSLMAMFGWWAINSFNSFWIKSSSPQARYVQAIQAFKLGNHSEAAVIAEAGLQKNPRHGKLRSLLSNTWNVLGQTQRGRQLAEETLQLLPDDPIAHFDWAAELAAENRFEEAITYLRKAIGLAPDLAIAQTQLTALLMHTENFSEALPQCREALRVNPYDRNLRAWLVQLETKAATKTIP